MSSKPLDSAVIANELAEQTRNAAAAKDLKVSLAAVTELAVQIGLCDYAGVTERVGDGEFRTSGPTDELVVTADRRQYELLEGPCVRASYENGVLSSADVANDARWPKWGPVAAGLGIKSVLSVHLYAGTLGMGALNLYSTASREYDPDEVLLASTVGAHASIALAHANRESNLWKAIDARHVVGVAQGIIRHEYDISIDKALMLLTRVSQQRNIKLRDLATAIVEANGAGPLKV